MCWWVGGWVGVCARARMCVYLCECVHNLQITVAASCTAMHAPTFWNVQIHMLKRM